MDMKSDQSEHNAQKGEEKNISIGFKKGESGFQSRQKQRPDRIWDTQPCSQCVSGDEAAAA
jgi:hypothetical protein